MSNPFPFDVAFQRSIVRLAMLDEGFAVRAYKHVQPSYFTTRTLGWIWTSMLAYWQKYAVRMTEIPLRDALRFVEPEDVALYAAEIDAICAVPYVAEHAYIKVALAEFCKRSLFAENHKASETLYNQGKFDAVYDATQRAMDKIREISFEDENRAFFFEEFEDRQKRRLIESASSFQSIISTGLGPLDDLCNGGAAEGEVWLVQGYAKAGKSTWLLNMGFTCLRMHREPVLHIQLEGKRQQTEDRYDTRFAGELYSVVKKGEITPTLYRDILEEYRRLRGLLVIRALTDWDTTVLDIETELKNLGARGFKPKMLVCDYLDLLRSRNKYVDSETQHQLEAARDLKRLTMNWNLVTHTASQTQRPEKNADDVKHLIKSGSVADAYGKVRIVDFLGSLNATREERAAGVSRFLAEFHRDSPMGVVLKLQNDISRMQMGIQVTTLDMEEAAVKPKQRSYGD